MAATVFSVEVARECLFEEGFFDWKDLTVGEDVLKMEQRSFEYFSECGLDFCKQHILNERVISIVESFFDNENYVLGHWLRYIAYPGHIVCFRRGGRTAGRRALIVHLIAKGSRVGYYGGSHSHELPTSDEERLLYETPGSALAAWGCQSEEREFPDGGLAICDARISFEIKQGYAITFEFATADLVERWPKMIIPSSPELRKKVADMESALVNRKIRMHVGFRDTTGN